MTTKFCLIRYFDPYGDGKSARKELKRTNYITDKSMEEVKEEIREVNKKQGYYSQIVLREKPDGRLKHFKTLTNL